MLNTFVYYFLVTFVFVAAFLHSTYSSTLVTRFTSGVHQTGATTLSNVAKLHVKNVILDKSRSSISGNHNWDELSSQTEYFASVILLIYLFIYLTIAEKM